MEEKGDELGSEGVLGTKELGAGVDRVLQLIGLQNSDIDSDLPDCKPQAAPETLNSDPLAEPRPLSAWYRGKYALRQTLSVAVSQADRNRREKDKEQVLGACTAYAPGLQGGFGL